MKKIFFSLLVMLLGSLTVSAQKDVKVRFGLEGGFNMTQWNGEMVPNYTLPTESIITEFSDAGLKPGFHAGGLMDLVIQDHWSIQPELLFAMEGSKIKVGEEDFVNATALYIRIPILVYYNFLNVGPGQLSPGIGIFLSGGVGGTVENGGKTFGTDGILDEFDWGANVKIAYELQKVASGLFFSAGFSQGLTTSKSTGLSVSVGYKFQYAKIFKRAYNTGVLEYNP
ncbi:MAG: PorT family protein [Paludibacteraceae bacterium]|nr:PorT family protein [Paludibacteraceae bacterium]